METLDCPCLDNFEAHCDEERKVCDTLKELVARQRFDAEKGRLFGPRISIADVARRTDIPRNAIGQDGCRLQRARNLILEVIESLKDYSLKYECDYLRAENDRLRARIDIKDSENAGAAVREFKEQKEGAPTSDARWTAAQVRAAAKIASLRRLK